MWFFRREIEELAKEKELPVANQEFENRRVPGQKNTVSEMSSEEKKKSWQARGSAYQVTVTEKK